MENPRRRSLSGVGIAPSLARISVVDYDFLQVQSLYLQDQKIRLVTVVAGTRTTRNADPHHAHALDDRQSRTVADVLNDAEQGDAFLEFFNDLGCRSRRLRRNPGWTTGLVQWDAGCQRSAALNVKAENVKTE